MAVTEEIPLIASVANGVTTVFSHSFTILSAADLVVSGTLAGVTTTYALGVHYTIAGVGSNAGSITFLSAPANNTVITRYRDTGLTRGTDYQDNGDLPADTLNADIDRVWYALQEIVSGGKGSPTTVRVQDGESIPALPAAAARANRVLAFDSSGNPTVIVGVDSSSAASLALDLASTASASKGAGQTGYNAALNYAAGTVGFELNKRKSVFATGVAATDVANMQAAINGAADYTCIDFFGAFATNARITLRPKVWLRFNYATITHTNSAADLFAYTPGAPTGFPGQIILENIQATGPGNTGTSTMLKIDANCPGVCVKGGMAGGFYQFIYLRDAYASVIDQFRGYTCTFGIQLVRESHASTIRDTLIDGATTAAAAVNYGGGAGTGTCHNVNVIGGALQNSAVGLWAENCLELHTVGVYHEGNTVNDYRIGVGDAGAYLRACYNVVIDGFSSSSPCGSDRNIRIEHSVGVQVRAAAWNSGCSTTATLASYDGFSDRIDIDIMRFTTTTPTATAPVDCTADPTRGVVRYRGRPIFGSGVTDAISGGTLASKLWNLGHQQIGGRDSAVLKSILDVVLQVGAGGVVKVNDSAGNDQFSFAIPLASSAPGAGSKSIWYDPADANRVKFQP